MITKQRGFGLVEVLIALVLGLIVVLGISQIFVTAKQTYFTQDASARLQEDARYALSRIVQELRMAGMYGCISLNSITNKPAAFDEPIDWESDTLTIVTSTPTSGAVASSSANWTIVTDCRSSAVAETGSIAPGTGEIALPVRQVAYKLENGSLMISEGGGAFQPLISGVADFDVEFGQAATATDTYVTGDYVSAADAEMPRVRSVRISLEMTDAQGRVADQTYNVVAALRNRLL